MKQNYANFVYGCGVCVCVCVDCLLKPIIVEMQIVHKCIYKFYDACKKKVDMNEMMHETLAIDCVL